jgi:hypothetical protein
MDCDYLSSKQVAKRCSDMILGKHKAQDDMMLVQAVCLFDPV